MDDYLSREVIISNLLRNKKVLPKPGGIELKLFLEESGEISRLKNSQYKSYYLGRVVCGLSDFIDYGPLNENQFVLFSRNNLSLNVVVPYSTKQINANLSNNCYVFAFEIKNVPEILIRPMLIIIK